MNAHEAKSLAILVVAEQERRREEELAQEAARRQHAMEQVLNVLPEYRRKVDDVIKYSAGQGETQCSYYITPPFPLERMDSVIIEFCEMLQADGFQATWLYHRATAEVLKSRSSYAINISW